MEHIIPFFFKTKAGVARNFWQRKYSLSQICRFRRQYYIDHDASVVNDSVDELVIEGKVLLKKDGSVAKILLGDREEELNNIRFPRVCTPERFLEISNLSVINGFTISPKTAARLTNTDW